MAKPKPYQPTTSFADEATNNAPGRSPINGKKVDAELKNIASTINTTISNLNTLQRDDGQLTDGVVDVHALSRATLNLMGGFNSRGPFIPNRSYKAKDIVDLEGELWVCIESHYAESFDDEKFNRFGLAGGEDVALSAAQAAKSAAAAEESREAADGILSAVGEKYLEVEESKEGAEKSAQESALAASSSNADSLIAVSARVRAEAAADKVESWASSPEPIKLEEISTADAAIVNGWYVSRKGVPVDGTLYVVRALEAKDKLLGDVVYQVADSGESDGHIYFRTIIKETAEVAKDWSSPTKEILKVIENLDFDTSGLVEKTGGSMTGNLRFVGSELQFEDSNLIWALLASNGGFKIECRNKETGAVNFTLNMPKKTGDFALKSELDVVDTKATNAASTANTALSTANTAKSTADAAARSAAAASQAATAAQSRADAAHALAASANNKPTYSHPKPVWSGWGDMGSHSTFAEVDAEAMSRISSRLSETQVFTGKYETKKGNGAGTPGKFYYTVRYMYFNV